MTTGPNKAISDLEYDLLTALQNKAQAHLTYDKYIQDAQSIDSQPCVELFKKLKQADESHIQELRHHLKEVMEKGKM